MSTLIVFANNASSLLASGILSTDATLTVNSGDGSLFPAIAAGQIAVGTLEDTSGNIEVVHITAKTGDAMTILRAQESTAAAPFASGSRFELRVTAGILATLLQKTGSDTLSGTTAFTGILNMGSAGSIRGGELAGVAIRGAPAETDNQVLVPSGGGAATAGGSPLLTAANLVANLPAGVGVALTNMVVFWAGTSGSVPAGWHLCDGTAGTPDLRDQFILGAGGSLPSSGGSSSTTTGATSLSGLAVGGTSLTVDQLPPHNHMVFVGTDTLNGAGVGFAVSGVNGGAHYPGPHGTDANGHTETTGTGTPMVGNVHTHSLSGTTAHTHSYTLPPYRALFAIMKL